MALEQLRNDPNTPATAEPDYLEPKTEPKRSQWRVRMLTIELSEKSDRIDLLEENLRAIRRQIDDLVPRRD